MSKRFITLALVLVSCGSPATVAVQTGPVPAPTVVRASVPSNVDESTGLVRDPVIASMLADIDPAHIRHTDSMLVSFGTRNTFSDTLSNTRGIGAARRWIYSQFQQYSRD